MTHNPFTDDILLEEIDLRVDARSRREQNTRAGVRKAMVRGAGNYGRPFGLLADRRSRKPPVTLSRIGT